MMYKLFATILLTVLTMWVNALNVKDFGAKGDGKTDDTRAIQRCVNAASTNVQRGAYGEVFFPEGVYLISETIVVKNQTTGTHPQVSLRGDKATVKGLDPAKDLFYFEKSWRHYVDGLTFDGGKRQLKFWSNNIDTGRILVTNCTFKNASGFAFEDMLRQTVHQDKSNYLAVLEPCKTTIYDDGRVDIEWMDEEKHPAFFFTSTEVIIRDSVFLNNAKVARISADWAMILDCRIETSPDQQGAAIVSLGQLILENVEGLARNNPEIASQYWLQKVDCRNQFGIHLRNVKLKTDSDAGWAVIHNYCRFGADQNSLFFFEDCEFESADSRENAILYLPEIPNIIHMKSVRESTGRPVNAIGSPKPLQPEDISTAYYYSSWNTDAERKSMAQDRRKFKFGIDKSCENVIDNLPAFLREFEDKNLSPEQLAMMKNFPRKILSVNEMAPKFKKQLTLDQFRGGPASRLISAVAAASKMDEPVEIILPNGVYTLNKPLVLPPEIALRGEGVAVFTASKQFPEGEPLFIADDAKMILIRRIFVSETYGNTIADFRCEAGKGAEILFDSCSFERTRGGITVTVGNDGTKTVDNDVAVTIANSTFSSSQALVSNAGYNTIDCVWVTSDAELKDRATFINYGNLYMRGMLGVPVLNTQQKHHYRIAGVETSATNNHRWTDNYGNFFADRCRFGGESKGMPIVFNYSKDALLCIRESWGGSYGGNPDKRTLVYLVELPKLLLIQDMPGWPEYYVLAQSAGKQPFGSIFFSSFCIAVRGDDGKEPQKVPED